MSTIFSLDNLFFRTVSRLVDLFWINLLTLVVSLPVITAGPAICAMYSLLLKMANGEEGNLTRGFFAALRGNFKKAFPIWLVMMAIAGFYGAEFYLLRTGTLAAYPLMENVVLVFLIVIAALWLAALAYIFGLIARYENDNKTTVKNAFLIGMVFLPQTICVVILSLLPLALSMLSNWFLYLWPLYGFAFPAWPCARILRRVFDKTQEKTEA